MAASRVDGRPVAITSPVDAVRSNIGISLVPEDRKTEALFLKLSGRHNVSLPVIERFCARAADRRRGRGSGGRARPRARSASTERALWTRVGAFSGGNQQKIAIAKWLLAESRVLLLYDPTRGIDVGTKNELYASCAPSPTAGGAILFYSTEIPELVNLSDRVPVFYAGRVGAELAGEGISEAAIMTVALGGAPAGRAGGMSITSLGSAPAPLARPCRSRGIAGCSWRWRSSSCCSRSPTSSAPAAQLF